MLKPIQTPTIDEFSSEETQMTSENNKQYDDEYETELEKARAGY